MTTNPVKLKELIKAREVLTRQINTKLTTNERQFLLSLKLAEPNWTLLDIPNIDKLPAIQWKIENIKKMDKKKHQESVNKLKSALNL